MRRHFRGDLFACAITIVLLLSHVQALAATPTSKALAGTRQAAEMKAKQWFYAFRSGDIDRTQLDGQCNLDLTKERVSQIRASLLPYRVPTMVVFVGTSPAGSATGYSFILQFANGRVLEAIALDSSGKIVGFDFQTFVKSTSPQ